MTPADRERWARVQRLFENALACSRRERDGYLDRVCAGDAALRREVASLIAADERGDARLDGMERRAGLDRHLETGRPGPWRDRPAPDPPVPDEPRDGLP